MNLTLLIPTRHRAELAIASIQSVLAQDHPVTVVVSDNSSRQEEVRLLAEFCRTTDDPRLHYIRPPETLAMPTHWDWALAEAMARTDATHFGVHYDRKLLKTGSITRLAAASAYDADAVVTYACDFSLVQDDAFLASPYRGSGKLYEISTSPLVRKVAGGTFQDFGQAIPILSNCIVPRSTLERVRTRFGSICDSNAPDLTFLFRLLALEPRYLHLDAALSVLYAFRYSNAQGYFRSDTTGTFGDFMELWAGRPWLEAAPIPGLTLGLNVVFHEYNLVQNVVGSEAFPPVDMQGYLRELAHGFFFIHDERQRAEFRAVLEKYGWRPEPSAKPRPLWRRIAGRVARPVRRMLASRRPGPTRTFATEAESIDYLLSDPLPSLPHNPLLTILDAVEAGSPR
jgi:glycosyltransferase involved in cell wall biosynthesis